MAKYIVLETLSFGSSFAHPGEEVELDDETALVLMRKRAIKPAEFRQENKTSEVKDGSNN